MSRDVDMLRIGLALGGGSMRAAAHVGALKCLHDYGIRPSAIAGTSAGSVVAGLYASGVSPNDLEEITLNLTPRKVFDAFPPLVILASLAKVLNEAVGGPACLLKRVPSGIIKGRRLAVFLQAEGIARAFEKMRIPCVVTAAEVDTGRKVLFTDRPTKLLLARRYRLRRSRTVVMCGIAPTDAITASCAIPGVFAPQRINGMQLVDGGIKDNLPLEPLDLLGCDILIGVDLGYAGERRQGVDNIAEIVVQSIEIMAQQSVHLSVEMLRSRYRDRLVRVMPKTYDIGLFDTSRIAECINRGYQAMRKCMVPLSRMIKARSER